MMERESGSSKGQMQIQFNWIFVIIVGAVLLGFLLSLTGTQTDVAEKRITSSTARQIDTIITSTAQKSGTFKQYTKVPQREISFYCNHKNGLFHYEVSGVRAGTTKYDFFFTQESFVPENIYTWTLDWKMPTEIMTFTYLTHDDHAFIFYDDSSTEFNRLYEPFPKNFTHVAYNETTVDSFSQDRMNYDGYTYVFLESQEIPDDLKEGIRGDQALVITVNQSSDFLYDYGSVSFQTPSEYQQGAETDNAPYLGKASLYGALFSGSKQLYECTMKKAYEYLNMRLLMEYDRIEKIAPDVGPQCQRLLVGVDDGIPRAKQFMGNMTERLQQGIETEDDVKFLHDKNQAIKDNNYKLSMQGNCPLLY